MATPQGGGVYGVAIGCEDSFGAIPAPRDSALSRQLGSKWMSPTQHYPQSGSHYAAYIPKDTIVRSSALSRRVPQGALSASGSMS
jgi:hypothetical protein